jgi:hypothetical protein
MRRGARRARAVYGVGERFYCWWILLFEEERLWWYERHIIDEFKKEEIACGGFVYIAMDFICLYPVRGEVARKVPMYYRHVVDGKYIDATLHAIVYHC